MSSGQAALADERADAARKAHKERLEKLGTSEIAGTVEDLENELQRFERDLAMLPRTGWMQLDRIKALVARLS